MDNHHYRKDRRGFTPVAANHGDRYEALERSRRDTFKEEQYTVPTGYRYIERPTLQRTRSRRQSRRRSSYDAENQLRDDLHRTITGDRGPHKEFLTPEAAREQVDGVQRWLNKTDLDRDDREVALPGTQAELEDARLFCSEQRELNPRRARSLSKSAARHRDAHEEEHFEPSTPVRLRGTSAPRMPSWIDNRNDQTWPASPTFHPTVSVWKLEQFCADAFRRISGTLTDAIHEIGVWPYVHPSSSALQWDMEIHRFTKYQGVVLIVWIDKGRLPDPRHPKDIVIPLGHKGSRLHLYQVKHEDHRGIALDVVECAYDEAGRLMPVGRETLPISLRYHL
ncbi:hypothetical protein T439DRAFT_358735 [Meredithblackwellia eburnea MCA 4105]